MKHPYYQSAAEEQHQAAKEEREREVLAFLSRIVTVPREQRRRPYRQVLPIVEQVSSVQ